MDNYSNTNNQNLKKFLDIVNQSKTIYNGKVIGQDGGSLIVKIEGKTLKLPSLGNKSSEVIVVRDKDTYSLLPSYNNFNNELYNITLRNRKRRKTNKKKKQEVEIIGSPYAFLSFRDINKEIGYLNSEYESKKGNSNTGYEDNYYYLISFDGLFNIYLISSESESIKKDYEYSEYLSFTSINNLEPIPAISSYTLINETVTKYYYIFIKFKENSFTEFEIIKVLTSSSPSYNYRDAFIEDSTYYVFNIKLNNFSFLSELYDLIGVSLLDTYNLTVNIDTNITVSNNIENYEILFTYSQNKVPFLANNKYLKEHLKNKKFTDYKGSYDYSSSDLCTVNITNKLTPFFAEGSIFLGGFGVGGSYFLVSREVTWKVYIAETFKDFNLSLQGIGLDKNFKGVVIGSDILSYSNIINIKGEDISRNSFENNISSNNTEYSAPEYTVPIFGDYYPPVEKGFKFIGIRDYILQNKSLPKTLYYYKNSNESYSLVTERIIPFYYFYKGEEKSINQNYSRTQTISKTINVKELSNYTELEPPSNGYDNRQEIQHIVEEKNSYTLLRDFNSLTFLISTNYKYNYSSLYNLQSNSFYTITYKNNIPFVDNKGEELANISTINSDKKYTKKILLLNKNENSLSELEDVLTSSFYFQYATENIKEILKVPKTIVIDKYLVNNKKEETYTFIDNNLKEIENKEETINTNFSLDLKKSSYIFFNDKTYKGLIDIVGETEYDYDLKLTNLIELPFKRSTFAKNILIVFSDDCIAMICKNSTVKDKILLNNLYFIVNFELFDDQDAESIDTYVFILSSDNKIKLNNIYPEPVYKLKIEDINDYEYFGGISDSEL